VLRGANVLPVVALPKPPRPKPPIPKAAAGLDASMQDAARSKPQSVGPRISPSLVEVRRMAISRFSVIPSWR
jgi:hypothetical protein